MIAMGLVRRRKRHHLCAAVLAAGALLLASLASAEPASAPAPEADAGPPAALAPAATPDAGAPAPAAAPEPPPPAEAVPPPFPPAPPLALPPEEEARHGIGVHLGVRATTVRDDLLVPLTFSGAGPDIGGTYRGLIGPGLLDTRLQLGLALVANRFNHLGMTLHHSLAAAYRLPVHQAGSWRYAVGGVLGESSDSLLLESWDDAHGYWVGLLWLGPSGSIEGPLAEGWQLFAVAEIGLLGTVGRPPEIRLSKQDPTERFSYYAFHTHAHPSFFLPWDVQFLRFDVAARRTSENDRIGRGWSFGLQGRFTRADMPQTILVFESVLYAAWTWGLR